MKIVKRSYHVPKFPNLDSFKLSSDTRQWATATMDYAMQELLEEEKVVAGDTLIFEISIGVKHEDEIG